MKILRRLVLILFLLALGALTALGLQRFHRASPPRAQFCHTGLTLDKIREMADLVVLRVEIADVLECRIDGYVGGVKGVLMVRGDIELATDLSQAHLEQVNEEDRRAVLVLAPPQPRRARVNHEHTRLHAVGTHGFWILVPDDKPYRKLLDGLYAKAQESMAQAGQSSDLDQRARDHPQRVLGEFFRSIGWQVTIRWSDRPCG